jgi:hypothetical protein
MMPEEIASYRKLAAWLKEDPAPGECVLTEKHIKRVFLAANVLPNMLAHIDEQAKQIATLKSVVLKQYALKDFTRWQCFQEYEWDGVGDKIRSDSIQEAKKMLARELPMIDWSDVE